MSDLRESGAIEQDADIVCFIHRPEYYLHSSTDAEGRDIRGLAEFIVAKHRSGAVDDINMRFRSKFARFENWGEEQEIIQHQTVGSKLNNSNQDIDIILNDGSIDLTSSSDEPTPF